MNQPLIYAQHWGLQVIETTPSEYIIGIDEVGLGACAGPLVVCGAVFRKGWADNSVKDSKQFPGGGVKAHEKRLRVLKEAIKPVVLYQHIEVVPAPDIDALGLGDAIDDALRRTGVLCTHAYPDSIVAIDGERFPLLSQAKAVVAIPKGDTLVPAISAASIIAKTTRDAMMITLADIYPGYALDQHMGYLTEAHEKALWEKGLTPLHRRSVKKVQAIFEARAARGNL